MKVCGKINDRWADGSSRALLLWQKAQDHLTVTLSVVASREVGGQAVRLGGMAKKSGTI